MWENSSVLCIRDAVVRSHGDVNSDSLLVQSDRCRIAMKYWKEWKHNLYLPPPIRPSNLFLCTLAVKANLDQFWSNWNFLYEECWSACGLTLCLFKDRQRGRECKRDPSESLRVIIWWLMVGGCQIQRDKLWQARITLSCGSTVYLSDHSFCIPSSLYFLCPCTSKLSDRGFGVICPLKYSKRAACMMTVANNSVRVTLWMTLSVF